MYCQKHEKSYLYEILAKFYQITHTWMFSASCSMPTSGTFCHGDLVMKNILRPFFQEEQLSVTGERTFTKYWWTVQEACPGTVWPRPKWPKMCWRAVEQKSNQTKNLTTQQKVINFSQPKSVSRYRYAGSREVTLSWRLEQWCLTSYFQNCNFSQFQKY